MVSYTPPWDFLQAGAKSKYYENEVIFLKNKMNLYFCRKIYAFGLTFIDKVSLL